ncbi:MAG: site-specific integrase [Ignavibacteriae bacterium]|nr:site-specific integrase [Ignavibacteriota bacterium]MCB0753272.1 site-specific integrase [Ignavibacteriota bacterium]
MASIYSKRGILYLAYYVEDAFGKRKQESFSLNLKDNRENRKLAKKIKTEKEAELNKPNKMVLPFNLSLETAFEMYLKVKKNVSKKTKDNYLVAYAHLTNVVSPKTVITKITNKELARVVDYMETEKGLSRNTISSYTKDLNTFWNWMKSEEMIHKNIIPKIKQDPKTIVVIPDEDFDEILEILHKRNIEQYRFIKFLRLTGFRVGEALALNWENVNFRSNRIVLQNIKMKRKDEFPLYDELRNFLFEFNEKEGKIFPYKNSESLHFWWRLMKKTNYRYSLHSIRKTFATKLVNNKVSVFDTMKLLRHRNVATTMKYYTYADMQRLGEEANKVFKVMESGNLKIFNLKG